MTDEKLRAIKVNSKEFIFKDDLIEAIRDVCNILEDPYAVYVFNRLLEKLNDNKKICLFKDNTIKEEFE